MLRVCKTNFSANPYDLNRLYDCNRKAAEVWNACLEKSKEYYKENGRWISEGELKAELKGINSISSQSIQGVCEKYIYARTNTKSARDKGYKNIRYPYKEKKNYPAKWKKTSLTILEGGKIELSLGNWKGKRQKAITVYVKKLPAGDIKEIELVWDRGLKLAIAYDNGKKEKKNNNKLLAAIDPGEIHTIAAVSEKREGVIITGRKLRSIKRLRNKKQKELYKKMSRCKKGSRKWRKYKKALNYILGKAEAQQIDCLHKASRKFTDWSVEQGVYRVAIGDIEGIQRDTSPKKKKNKKKRRRKVNQKISQWQFGKLFDYLEYKLKEQGIKIEKTDESYTTQTCPVCGRRKKPNGRLYKCRCGYKEHRDIHGAKGILSKYKYKEIKDIGQVKSIKYLRPVLTESSRSPGRGPSSRLCSNRNSMLSVLPV